MPSFCSSIKSEYEALKKLNAEFALACQKAGDPRTLTADQLRTLQIQKQKLEQAKDALRDKIESKETRTWKKMWKRAMEVVIRSKDSRYSGLTIEQILQQNSFREGVVDGLKTMMERGEGNMSDARDAIFGLVAARELSLLTDEQQQVFEKAVTGKKIKEMVLLYCEGYIREGRGTKDNGWFGLTAFAIARRLGIIETVHRVKMEEDIHVRKFRNHFTNSVLEDVEHAKSGSALTVGLAMIGLVADRELDMIDLDDRKKIRKLVRTKEFQRNLRRSLVREFKEPLLREGNFEFLVPLYSLKRLIELSRRHKPKQTS